MRTSSSNSKSDCKISVCLYKNVLLPNNPTTQLRTQSLSLDNSLTRFRFMTREYYLSYISLLHISTAYMSIIVKFLNLNELGQKEMYCVEQYGVSTIALIRT